VAVYLLNNKRETNYVAFVIHGGLGDKIRERSVLESLLSMFPNNTVVDIYNRRARIVFNGVNIRFFLDLEIWQITKNKYDVMYVLSGNAAEIFYVKSGKGFVDTILKNISNHKNTYFSENNKNRHLVSDIKAKSGVGNINDLSLSVNYKRKSLEKFNIGNSLKYITIQYGFGGDGKNDDVKCWNTNNWERLIKILKNRFSNISIIQIGISSYKLQNVDINVAKKTSYNELCSILKNSLLHIDIDGACSHISWALGTKSIVLFGPTDAQYCAYPGNINIMSSICGSCWNKFCRCIIGEEKPSVCMNSIKPEFVAQKAIEYISSLNLK
jgi:ADP-heptose:LPS heptosyltransferase